jgi:hypothetical protein
MLSSVSKMFTAVTIAKLVERKQLSFDNTLGSNDADVDAVRRHARSGGYAGHSAETALSSRSVEDGT